MFIIEGVHNIPPLEQLVLELEGWINLLEVTYWCPSSINCCLTFPMY
jgi:hypothetical protein